MFITIQPGSAQISSGLKDRIISQLKADIFEATQVDKQYQQLREYQNSVEDKVRRLEEDLRKADKEFRRKQDKNLAMLKELKLQTDEVQNQLQERRNQGKDVKAQTIFVQQQI